MSGRIVVRSAIVLGLCALSFGAGLLFGRGATESQAEIGSKYPVVPLRWLLPLRVLDSRLSPDQVRTRLVHAPRPPELNRILAQGEPDPTTYELGPELNVNQAERLRQVLLDDRTAAVFGVQNGCWFHPDIEFQFTDRSGQSVLTVTVCFTCREIRAEDGNRVEFCFGPDEVFDLVREIFPDREFGLGEE